MTLLHTQLLVTVFVNISLDSTWVREGHRVRWTILAAWLRCRPVPRQGTGTRRKTQPMLNASDCMDDHTGSSHTETLHINPTSADKLRNHMLKTARTWSTLSRIGEIMQAIRKNHDVTCGNTQQRVQAPQQCRFDCTAPLLLRGSVAMATRLNTESTCMFVKKCKIIHALRHLHFGRWHFFICSVDVSNLTNRQYALGHSRCGNSSSTIPVLSIDLE